MLTEEEEGGEEEEEEEMSKIQNPAESSAG